MRVDVLGEKRVDVLGEESGVGVGMIYMDKPRGGRHLKWWRRRTKRRRRRRRRLVGRYMHEGRYG